MGRANFTDMKFGLPMIVGRTFQQMKEDYEEAYNDEYNDSMYEIDEQVSYDYAAEMAKDFSDTLTFHVVEVIGGSYCGFQFFVRERYESQFDLNSESAYCIDNDDAHYYFDDYRSVVLRKANAEKRKIERWLNHLVNHGYNRIACVGRFSNGEAVYAIA